MEVDRKRIIVAPGLRYRLEDRIAEFCKECRTEVVDSKFEGWPMKFGKAGFLVVNHLSNLIPVLLMSPGSTVIDATPEQYHCSWAREFAIRNDLEYVTIRNASRCECDSLTCYHPEFTPELTDMDISAIVTLLKDALDSSVKSV
jgi:hypothetical protein